jgi:hypothetical protein
VRAFPFSNRNAVPAPKTPFGVYVVETNVRALQPTILRASVVLPENESPHIRYNVFILRVYFRRINTSSARSHKQGATLGRRMFYAANSTEVRGMSLGDAA